MTVVEITLVIGTITTSVVTIINTIKGSSDRADIKAQTTQQTNDLKDQVAHVNDTQNVKLEEIHDLTNSNLSLIKAQLADAQAQIKALQEIKK